MDTRLACAIGLTLALAGGIAGEARAEEPSPQQKIAVTAKPAVVRVWGAYIATYEIGGEKVQEAIGGSGTGFFITPDGYIATNAHVVADIQAGDDKAKEALKQQLYKDLDKQFGAELARMSRAEVERVLQAIHLVEIKKWAYIVLPSGDKLDYEIKQYGKPGTGRDCAIIKVKTDNAPTLPIGDSAKSQVEDRIVVIGYPGVADMKELLDDKSQLQASVTDGAISSLKRATSGEQILQISAPITHGNSGGPAIDQRGNVVGLATFGNEGEIQGFNFLVASATLMEMVKDAKIEPKESDTTKAWRAGLEHYWSDEYTAAITKFEEVETMFPAHSEAAGFIRNAHQAQKEGKEKKPSSNTGLIAGAIGGGIAVLGLLIVLATRKKKTPGQPAATSQPMPGQPGQFAGGPMPGQPGQPMPGRAHPPTGQQMYGRAPVPGQPMPGQFAGGPMPGQPMPGQQMPGQQMPGGPPMMPAPMGGAPMGGMMAGGVGAQPIAKTVAINSPGGPGQSGGIAPTAFGSLAIGSLTCTRGVLAGHRFALTATGIIVGRQPGVAHVLVNDHRASGKHVWIGIDQGRLVAIDQGTTNGTYINDINRGRITRAELRDGDVVIVSEPDCLSLQIKLG